MNQDTFDRYLRLLNISRRAPSLCALTELVVAQVTRVPFENISKLHRRMHSTHRGLASFGEFLDGVEHNKYGGTCYTTNYYLNLLMNHLGYDAILCGADMLAPDVHMVSIVALDGREYMVDAGYAAPFMGPLPRDLPEDHVLALGRDRYVLRPQDRQGRSRIDHFRDNILIHGYTAKPTPRAIEFFGDVIADSFRDAANFMNSLLCVRFFPGRSLTILNRELISSEGATSRIQTLNSLDDVVAAVVREFGMPRELVAEVLATLPALKPE